MWRLRCNLNPESTALESSALTSRLCNTIHDVLCLSFHISLVSRKTTSSISVDNIIIHYTAPSNYAEVTEMNLRELEKSCQVSFKSATIVGWSSSLVRSRLVRWRRQVPIACICMTFTKTASTTSRSRHSSIEEGGACCHPVTLTIIINKRLNWRKFYF